MIVKELCLRILSLGNGSEVFSISNQTGVILTNRQLVSTVGVSCPTEFNKEGGQKGPQLVSSENVLEFFGRKQFYLQLY